jgi:hypothetical protein
MLALQRSFSGFNPFSGVSCRLFLFQCIPKAQQSPARQFGPQSDTPFWRFSAKISKMSLRLVVAVVLMGCALPAMGFVSSGLRTANVLNFGRCSAVARRQMNTLPLAGRQLSQRAVHLRMSEDSTTVKEQCDGPAKEGEIGNVDVSAAKVGIEDIPTDGVIQLSENAKKQLTQLRKARGDAELVLRVGVRSGGCRYLNVSFR